MDPGTATDISHSQGTWAVSHARKVVESVVIGQRKPPVPDDLDPVFEVDRGAFVTLRKSGELRGCIGRPWPEQTAIEAIRVAAVEAATNDPRFPAVKPAELGKVTVEVSILTPPQEIETVDPETITVGRDGLIVERNGQSGLLLPQVPVEEAWDPKTFLDHSCRKAGLEEGCWKNPETDVRRFSAQVFAETEPRGPIEPAESVKEEAKP